MIGPVISPSSRLSILAKDAMQSQSSNSKKNTTKTKQRWFNLSLVYNKEKTLNTSTAIRLQLCLLHINTSHIPTRTNKPLPSV